MFIFSTKIRHQSETIHNVTPEIKIELRWINGRRGKKEQHEENKDEFFKKKKSHNLSTKDLEESFDGSIYRGIKSLSLEKAMPIIKFYLKFKVTSPT